MINGEFNERGELFFEIDLISIDGEIIPTIALLDTGFTGWLAIDNQDADSLGWTCRDVPQNMQTARGEESFNLYAGNILIDGGQFNIEVLGGNEIETILLGVWWLQTKRLVVDFPKGLLTL